jgi:hypothetical protein
MPSYIYFLIALAALVVGYFLYSRVAEHLFGMTPCAQRLPSKWPTAWTTCRCPTGRSS